MMAVGIVFLAGLFLIALWIFLSNNEDDI